MSSLSLTVLTQAPDRMLATAADVWTQLALPGAVPTASLNPLILEASDAISSDCGGRVFGRESLRQVFRLDRAMGSLVLARGPVSTVTSLVADGITLVEGTDFEVDAVAGLIFRLSGDRHGAWCAAKITVAYAAGWLLPSQENSDLPRDVRRLCIDRAARLWAGRGRDGTIRSEGAQDVGQVSYFDPDKLAEEEERVLKAYRVWAV